MTAKLGTIVRLYNTHLTVCLRSCDNLVYAGALMNRAVLSPPESDYQQALGDLNRAIKIMEDLGKEGIQLYLLSLGAKSIFLIDRTDLPELEAHSEKIYRFITSQLMEVFPKLTEEERSTYWNKVAGWYSRICPTSTLLYPTPKMAEICYNSILQSKGILLNSTINIDKLLQQTNDPDLLDMRKQWAESKEWFNKAAYKGTYDVDEAYQTFKYLEKRILGELSKHGNFMDDLKISVKDVKAALDDRDLAVEFVLCTNLEDSDTTYMALTMRRNFDAPHAIRLGDAGHLASIIDDESFGGLGKDLYDFVWNKILADAGDDVKRIFFSVDGLLYNIPIEYCESPDGKIMAERYRCLRVSSTREIAKSKDRPIASPPNEIVIYGGIDYNAEPQKTSFADFSILDKIIKIQRGMRSAETDYSGVSVFDPLDGTKEEIDSIAEVLQDANLVPIIKQSDAATKTSVRLLSELQPKIMHFATHGIYVNCEEKKHYNFLNSFFENIDNEEDEMLSRSALIMAGANNIMTSPYIKTADNGFLTAREIANLDLASLDLAVLSACETAKGDITGEGVFGLQRGFKKAGTNSLLMSLVRVNDYTTMQFMKTFYSSLFTGKTDKYDALLNAIRHVRTMDGGMWNQPEFWACFILLDAIN